MRSAILGFLDLEPSSGYTLLQRFQGSVGSFWTATQSQIYRELHQLERDKLVRVTVVPQDGKPSKKIYALTAAGKQALARWLAEPVGPLQLRDPLLLKLVFASNVPPAALDDVLVHYSEELEQRRTEYRARLDAPEIFDLARSEREADLWRLSIESGLAWCDAMLAWSKKARQKLGAKKRRQRR